MYRKIISLLFTSALYINVICEEKSITEYHGALHTNAKVHNDVDRNDQSVAEHDVIAYDHTTQLQNTKGGSNTLVDVLRRNIHLDYYDFCMAILMSLLVVKTYQTYKKPVFVAYDVSNNDKHVREEPLLELNIGTDLSELLENILSALEDSKLVSTKLCEQYKEIAQSIIASDKLPKNILQNDAVQEILKELIKTLNIRQSDSHAQWLMKIMKKLNSDGTNLPNDLEIMVKNVIISIGAKQPSIYEKLMELASEHGVYFLAVAVGYILIHVIRHILRPHYSASGPWCAIAGMMCTDHTTRTRALSPDRHRFISEKSMSLINTIKKAGERIAEKVRMRELLSGPVGFSDRTRRPRRGYDISTFLSYLSDRMHYFYGFYFFISIVCFVLSELSNVLHLISTVMNALAFTEKMHKTLFNSNFKMHTTLFNSDFDDQGDENRLYQAEICQATSQACKIRDNLGWLALEPASLLVAK